MDRCHQTILYAKGVIENLHHWDETVGGATRIGNHFVLRLIEILVVNPVHESCICAVGRCRHNHHWRSRFKMSRRFVAVCENAS